MEEALELGPDALAVADVWAVGIALLVREGVVLAVVGDPGDHRPLDRRGAEGAHHGADRGTRLEAAMGEEPVEADRDPEPGRDVDQPEDDEVAPVQPAAGELPDDESQHQEGDHGQEAGDDPVPGLVGDGLHGIGQWRASGGGGG